MHMFVRLLPRGPKDLGCLWDVGCLAGSSGQKAEDWGAEESAASRAEVWHQDFPKGLCEMITSAACPPTLSCGPGRDGKKERGSD